MSKRLQVVLDDDEMREIKTLAKRERVSVSSWVRAALLQARLSRPLVDAQSKIRKIRSAAQYSFPTADMDVMISEIESGYGQSQ